VKVTLPDGSVDLYCAPAEPGCHRCGGVSFAGTACLVRLDAGNALHSWELVEGTALVHDGEHLSPPIGVSSPV